MNRIMTFKLLDREHFFNLTGENDLDVIDAFLESGVTDIKVWIPECSCNAGWIDDEGYVYACSYCQTGIQRRKDYVDGA